MGDKVKRTRLHQDDSGKKNKGKQGGVGQNSATMAELTAAAKQAGLQVTSKQHGDGRRQITFMAAGKAVTDVIVRASDPNGLSIAITRIPGIRKKAERQLNL